MCFGAVSISWMNLQDLRVLLAVQKRIELDKLTASNREEEPHSLDLNAGETAPRMSGTTADAPATDT